MSNHLKFYINGAWVDPAKPATLDVINPATEEAFTKIAVGSAADVDRAVAAARAAFPAFSQTSKAERLALLKRILELRERASRTSRGGLRRDGRADGHGRAMPRPRPASAHLEATIEGARGLRVRAAARHHRIVREGIGVVGLITPWNWPLNQIACKVAPAFAAGCTMVLKPSEIAPINAIIFAEVMHAAGVPAGVFNLVNGDGPSVGQAHVGASRTSTWCPSPARPAPASWSPRPRPTRSSASARSWAASRPTSSCPTPISRRP